MVEPGNNFQAESPADQPAGSRLKTPRTGRTWAGRVERVAATIMARSARDL